MAHGFQAINDNGEIIISDEMEGLHFVGKAILTGNDGGDYGDFPGYSGSNDNLDGRVIFSYSISSITTPLVFIKPTDYSRWHCLLKKTNGTNWTFDVMASGLDTSNAPELYCFISADDTIPPTDTHGLLVYQPDGITRTFDSRLSPLAITDGGLSVPPIDPTDTAGLPGVTTGHPWNYATNDHNFKSTTRYNEYAINGTHTNLMFAAPSLAQAVYKRQMEGYKCSSNPFWEGGCQGHWSTALWWVMYRNSFRLRDGYFDSGWTNFAAGYAFSSSHESGGWFGGGGGSYSSGTMPYTAKTINLFSNAFLIADASGYD